MKENDIPVNWPLIWRTVGAVLLLALLNWTGACGSDEPPKPLHEPPVATTPAEIAYLAELRGHDMDGEDERTQLAAGKLVCEHVRAGGGLDAVLPKLSAMGFDNGAQSGSGGRIIASALANLCPELQWSVTR